MTIKLKRSIAMLIGLLLILSNISACGSVRNSPAGKWYNENGKCLDVRSDGSWKLEDSYGTGTWKYLEDKVTIEFTDFYGDTQESKINEDELGKYIDFGYYGNFYKDSYPSKESIAADTKTPTSKRQIDKTDTIKFATDFSDNLAWLQIADENGSDTVVLINTNGEIIFEDKNIDAPVLNKFDGGISYYTKQGNYYIINTEGKIVASSENGDFDAVKAYGDGLVLVYKYSGGIDHAEDLYGVLDNTGNWVSELKSIDVSPSQIAGKSISYVGSGVFAICFETQYLNTYSQSDWVLYNSKTSELLYVFNIDISPYFENNTAYIPCLIESDFWPGTDYPCLGHTKDENEAQKIEQSFSLNTDGTYNILSYNFSKSTGNKIIANTDDGYINIIDVNDNTETVFREYQASYITSIDYSYQYGLVTFAGQDGKKVFYCTG